MWGFLNNFFSNFSDRAKLFLLIFIISIITISLSLWLGGLTATSIVMVPAIYAILQVTKAVWSPEGGGKSKLALASLGVALIVVLSNPKWKPFINSLLEPLFDKYPSLKDSLPVDTPSITALIFLAVVIIALNYFARDTTAMKEHSTPIDKEFPEKNYKNLLRLFCGTLLDDLNKIDRETNWSAENFVPLDAEVEVVSGSKRSRKVTDLLTAIKHNKRSRIFLILGDPGSGKSVALRKLCRELLKEVERTGKVPLYINLREWEIKETWTENNLPTVHQLFEFVLSNLKSRGDIFTNEFLDKYFKKMFENGRLFVVLDSFDEIPTVLDVNENSWLIDSLSDVIYRFLSGAHESRGILASRMFRRPTNKFDAKTILEIRPFTESKIIESLRKSLFFDESLINLLFNQRSEFIPIARNPFTAALISNYAKGHRNTLPSNQAELYSDYILRRLEACKERIQKHNLTIKGVIQCAVDIADIMLTTETLGLEASVKDLKKELPLQPVEEAIDILVYARLGRLGSGDEQRFSFVHRRFNEYFVVQRLIEQPNKVPQDAIPTDSRWRDALVLYCEIAEETEAARIAQYCWSEIRQLGRFNSDMRNEQYLRGVHCLRFLKEAFRARRQCIHSFRRNLAGFIEYQFIIQDNLLSQKISVEAVGLLQESDIDSVLVSAFEINNQWIDETALKSCRHLPQLSEELYKKLRLYIDGIDDHIFFARRKELLFSMSLSNGFNRLKSFTRWREINIYIALFGILLIILGYPILFLLAMGFLLPFKKLLGNTWWRGSIRRIIAKRSVLPILLTTLLLLAKLDIEPNPFNQRLFFLSDLSLDSLYFLGILLTLPIYQIFYYFPELFPSKRKRVPDEFGQSSTESGGVIAKRVLRIMLIPIGLYIPILLLAYLFPDFMLSLLAIIISLIAVILVLGIVVAIFSYVYSTYSDQMLMLQLSRQTQLTREQIAEQFGQFATAGGRSRYIQFLKDKRIIPTGSWPDGLIPNVKDEASTLLAKLEEGWLGLDR